MHDPISCIIELTSDAAWRWLQVLARTPHTNDPLKRPRVEATKSSRTSNQNPNSIHAVTESGANHIIVPTPHQQNAVVFPARPQHAATCPVNLVFLFAVDGSRHSGERGPEPTGFL